jgi:trans-aconitate methyltransferase
MASRRLGGSVEATMGLFTGAASFYRQYRAPIPESVVAVLDAAAGQARPRRLLDLGTRTGLVLQALLGCVDDIIGVDADADMLAQAEIALRPTLAADTRLELVHARAEEFTAPPGWQAELVTVCRAFHWLDQQKVLTRLDAQVAPQGAVAIFADSSPWSSPAPWKAAVRAVVQEFLGEQRRAGSGVWHLHDRPFRDILRESVVSDVEEVTVPVRRTRNTESIICYLHSTSFAAPHLFGDRLEDFDNAIRHRLADLVDTDTFVDDNQFRIVIGRRPLHSPGQSA